jgi:hypothetical protein
MEYIPASVPLRKGILVSRINILGACGKESIGRDHSLSGADHFMAFFPRCFESPLNHKYGGFLVILDLKTVQAFFQNIKRSIRAVKLEFLLYVEGVDTQINIPGKQMKADKIILSLRKLGKVDLGVFIDTQIVLSSEMNFGPALTSTQLIALDNRHIDRAFLITHIASPLQKNISLDIIQTQKGLAVIFFFLWGGKP